MNKYFKLLTLVILALAAGSLWAGDAARVVFTAGEASIAGQAARTGTLVAEGELLTTGPTGYLYLETLDHGFFILRPNSTGQIVTYHIDTQNPANTRIKLELRNGVARHISGDAVKSARHNFRFNTPVAAVGVRGTDFTLFADQETTRITVLSGGVVASPLSAACTAGSFGPCDGPASRELFANTPGQILQIGRGMPPVLLQGIEQSPDAIAPPRQDEPSGQKTSARSASLPITPATTLPNLDPLKTDSINKLTTQAVGEAQASRAPQLIWGRWQVVLEKNPDINIAALRANNQLIGVNSYYALLRNSDHAWEKPTQAAMGFSLQQSQAVITNEVTRQATAATLENGLMQINFANATFFTKFDLVSQSERFQLQNNGEITPTGRLYGGYQFLRPNNMSVTGALANDNTSAAYLFQSRLDEQRLASGVTLWGK